MKESRRPSYSCAMCSARRPARRAPLCLPWFNGNCFGTTAASASYVCRAVEIKGLRVSGHSTDPTRKSSPCRGNGGRTPTAETHSNHGGSPPRVLSRRLLPGRQTPELQNARVSAFFHIPASRLHSGATVEPLFRTLDHSPRTAAQGRVQPIARYWIWSAISQSPATGEGHRLERSLMRSSRRRGNGRMRERGLNPVSGQSANAASRSAGC